MNSNEKEQFNNHSDSVRKLVELEDLFRKYTHSWITKMIIENRAPGTNSRTGGTTIANTFAA